MWRSNGAITLFVADTDGTGAYLLSGGRLRLAWEVTTDGTSPVVAGGLLYVYDPVAGGVNVYDPSSGHKLATVPSGPGHWNSPIAVDGHLIEPEGNANDHLQRGTLNIYTP